MQDNDRDYYTARARTERERAQQANDPAADKIHKEMADRYELMAVDATTRRLAES